MDMTERELYSRVVSMIPRRALVGIVQHSFME